MRGLPPEHSDHEDESIRAGDFVFFKASYLLEHPEVLEKMDEPVRINTIYHEYGILAAAPQEKYATGVQLIHSQVRAVRTPEDWEEVRKTVASIRLSKVYDI